MDTNGMSHMEITYLSDVAVNAGVVVLQKQTCTKPEMSLRPEDWTEETFEIQMADVTQIDKSHNGAWFKLFTKAGVFSITPKAEMKQELEKVLKKHKIRTKVMKK